MVDKDDPLLSAQAVADELKLSRDTLALWRCKGRGPRFVKVGRAVYYRTSAITAWLKSQERDPVKARA